MSNYYCSIKVKKTGEIYHNVEALDDFFGVNQYGYRVDGKVFRENEVDFPVEGVSATKHSTGKELVVKENLITKELTKDFIEGYLDAMKDISKIIENNKDVIFGTYDYDGIAKDVIELINK